MSFLRITDSNSDDYFIVDTDSETYREAIANEVRLRNWVEYKETKDDGSNKQ